MNLKDFNKAYRVFLYSGMGLATLAAGVVAVGTHKQLTDIEQEQGKLCACIEASRINEESFFEKILEKAVKSGYYDSKCDLKIYGQLEGLSRCSSHEQYSSLALSPPQNL